MAYAARHRRIGAGGQLLALRLVPLPKCVTHFGGVILKDIGEVAAL